MRGFLYVAESLVCLLHRKVKGSWELWALENRTGWKVLRKPKQKVLLAGELTCSTCLSLGYAGHHSILSATPKRRAEAGREEEGAASEPTPSPSSSSRPWHLRDWGYDLRETVPFTTVIHPWGHLGDIFVSGLGNKKPLRTPDRLNCILILFPSLLWMLGSLEPPFHLFFNN